MKFGELNTHIINCISKTNTESFLPCYVLTGDDHYVIGKIVKAFKKSANPDFKDFNLLTISKADGIKGCIDALCTFPMFDDFKIIFMLDCIETLVESELKAIKEYFQSPNKSSVLVLCASSVVVQQMSNIDAVTVCDCSKITDNEIYDEIELIVKKHPKKTITKDAKTELVKRTMSSISKVAIELQKLKAYVDSEITLDDVKQMVMADLEFKTYELCSAVSEKNANKALDIVSTFTKNGIKGSKIVNYLYPHYRRLLYAELNKEMRDDELAKLLGIKSTQVYHIKRVSKNYTQVKLKKSVDFLHNLQFDILTGKRLESSVLHEAVLFLLNI